MKENQTITYKIAEVKLQLNMPWEQTVSKAFRPFVSESEDYDWKITFQEKQVLEKFGNPPLFQNNVFRVYERTDGIFVRQYYNDRPDLTPYVSVAVDAAKKQVMTEYLPEAAGKFGAGEADFFCIAFEKILMEEQAMILHASCVDTPLGGILFSGHSGAGKSTQGDLWCRYGGAKLLNGDRPIIRQVGNEWRAYGSPYAGSSGCHINDSSSIRAIVFIQQAKECQVRKVQGIEKFRKIFGNLTVNLWDQAYVTKASAFVQRLAEAVPVYELKCTKDQEAVLALQKFLENEKH